MNKFYYVKTNKELFEQLKEVSQSVEKLNSMFQNEGCVVPKESVVARNELCELCSNELNRLKKAAAECFIDVNDIEFE